MDHKDLSDDMLLDRLVDGELSAPERRQLLASYDERPAGWRRCALRFLEAQSLGAELRALVRESAGRAADRDSSTLPLAEGSRLRERSRESEAPRVSWAVLAAGVLMAFTLGLFVRGVGSGSVARLANGDRRPHGTPIAQVVPPAPGASQVADALTLFVRDETGQTRPLRVPLVDAAELEQQFGLQFRTGLPDEVRNRLLSRGFDVRSVRRYAPLWLENGRPMFVPVEDTKIVPVSQKVY